MVLPGVPAAEVVQLFEPEGAPVVLVVFGLVASSEVSSWAPGALVWGPLVSEVGGVLAPAVHVGRCFGSQLAAPPEPAAGCSLELGAAVVVCFGGAAAGSTGGTGGGARTDGGEAFVYAAVWKGAARGSEDEVGVGAGVFCTTVSTRDWGR